MASCNLSLVILNFHNKGILIQDNLVAGLIKVNIRVKETINLEDPKANKEAFKDNSVNIKVSLDNFLKAKEVNLENNPHTSKPHLHLLNLPHQFQNLIRLTKQKQCQKQKPLQPLQTSHQKQLLLNLNINQKRLQLLNQM